MKVVGALICWLIAAVALGAARWMKTRGGRTNTLIDVLPEPKRYLGIYGVAAAATCLGVAALFTEA